MSTGASAPILQSLVRKVGERRFIAGVKFGGEWIFSEDKEHVTAGQARSAVGKLNEKLRAMKARVLLSEEYQMVEPKAAPIAPQQRRVVAPAAPKVRAEMPVVAKTEQGWTTPRSDRMAWVETYRHAVEACTGTKLEALQGLYGEEAKQFRADITAVMRSTGFIGPWDTHGEIPWVYIAGVFDPTTAPVKAGVGDRRVTKDINGIKRDASGEQVLEDSPFKHLQEEREAAIAEQMAPKAPPAASAPAASSAPASYCFGTPEQRKLAANQGRRLMKQAKEGGKDADTQKIWGMIGFVLALRAMGLPPHAEFERKLRESGVTEEWLQAKSRAA